VQGGYARHLEDSRLIYRRSNNVPNIFARVMIPGYNLFKYVGLYIKIPEDGRDSPVFLFFVSFTKCICKKFIFVLICSKDTCDVITIWN
jgi:hypothetical protein